MNGHSADAAGMESADTSSAADHPDSVQRGALDRTKDAIAAALRALEGCNKQEAQDARSILAHALKVAASGDFGP